MSITFPTNTTAITNAIRNAIGRNVTFITKTEELCPTCDLDPVSNTSTDSFCPTCSGVGYIYTISGYTVKAHVTWAGDSILNWQSAGQLFDGDCRIQVEYIPDTVTVVGICDYIVVDSKRLTIKKKILRGVPEINRILLDLKEQEDED